jgi:hypothetical protein
VVAGQPLLDEASYCPYLLATSLSGGGARSRQILSHGSLRTACRGSNNAAIYSFPRSAAMSRPATEPDQALVATHANLSRNAAGLFGATHVQCAGDGAKPDGSSGRRFGIRVVLTAFVLIGGRGTGIAIAASSGSSPSGAAW